jgi:hypothetical protein
MKWAFTPVLAGWDDYWMRPASPQALAAGRIVLYGYFLLAFGPVDFRLIATFGPDVWEPGWLMRLLGFHQPPSEGLLNGMQWVWKASLLAAVLGWQTRWATALAAVGAYFLLMACYAATWTNHKSAAAAIALGVMAFSHCGDAWSLDALWSRRPDSGPSSRYGWPIQIIRLQISIVFFFASLSKLRASGLGWVTSDTLQIYLLIQDYPAGRWMAGHPFLCHLLAAGTLLIEFLHPLALLSRRMAWVLLPGSALMILGFLVLMGIPFLPLLVLHVFWMPWDELFAWMRRRRTREEQCVTPEML